MKKNMIAALLAVSGIAAAGGAQATVITGSFLSPMLTVVTGPLANFIGSGNFTVGCTTLSGSTFNGGGANIQNVQNTTANCGADISYDYTPTITRVPEPTALWLLGVGLLGLAGVRRKFS